MGGMEFSGRVWVEKGWWGYVGRVPVHLAAATPCGGPKRLSMVYTIVVSRTEHFEKIALAAVVTSSAQLTPE